jgi:hypothetical protein
MNRICTLNSSNAIVRKYAQTHLIITLGNPKQQCRHFGICKAEVYDNWPALPEYYQPEKQCLAQICDIDYAENKALFVFLLEAMHSKVRRDYFTPHFFVQNRYCFSDAFLEREGFPPISILPGYYRSRKTDKGLCINFSISF